MYDPWFYPPEVDRPGLSWMKLWTLGDALSGVPYNVFSSTDSVVFGQFCFNIAPDRPRPRLHRRTRNPHSHHVTQRSMATATFTSSLKAIWPGMSAT